MPETVLFDRYRLLEAAGTGGSAEVWRARDEETGDEVAVKRLHPVVFADEAGRRRLRREFDALRSLDEPHVVRVRDLHFGDREGALILDFVPGPSVAQQLASRRDGKPAFHPQEAVAIVGDVAAALAAAHDAGIVHRDVTPGNILLAPDGTARLTDFGIAHASTDTTAVTATGLLMGTMRYLAPEQLRGEAATPASDLHGLAAVAYEMLAGHPAYAATSPVALADAQQEGPAPIAGVPAALDAAVRRGLAVDPAERPESVGAFAASLAAALETEPTVAIPIPVLNPVGAETEVAPAPVAEPAPSDPAPASIPAAAASGVPAAAPRGAPQALRTRRRRLPAPVLALGGLVIAAAVLAAAAGPDRPLFGLDAALPGASAPARAAPTARPSATPAPEKGGKGHDNGKGNGKGGEGGD